MYVRARVYLCWSVSVGVYWSVFKFLRVPACCRVCPSVLVCSAVVVSVVELVDVCSRV